jgi:glycosyltransferase involved in cell wall biosynthesis
MKILYCIPTLGDGGAERQLAYLAVQLSRMGHDVHVASSRGGTNLARFESAGVTWHPLGGVSNRDPAIFIRLVRLMRKLRPDVVQTILTPMDLMAGAATLLTRTPWLLKESSSARLYGLGLRYRWRLALGRRAHGIVSNSAGGAAYWSSVGAAPIGIIPNGVPLDEIEKADSELGLDPGLQSDAKVLVFAGRLDAGKNVENLLVALSRIANPANFVAFICGDGPRLPQLERLARDLGIAQRLIFTGYVSNLWSLMKRADAVISLSRFEGCPNVVTEAMACGCPLVVSDIPAHREILDESTASFVDPEEPDEAARAIAEVLLGDGRAAARASAARAKAAEWTVETAARQYERVYQRLLSDASRELPLVTSAECAHANES